MKMRLLPSLGFLIGLTSSLHAAPSAELRLEWTAHLETQPAIVLADKSSGQVRILRFSDKFELTESGPLATNTPNLTGLTTGINSSGEEHLALSSTTANTTHLIPQSLSTPIRFLPQSPGPTAALPFRSSSAQPESFYLHSSFADGGHALERSTSGIGSSPIFIDLIDKLAPLNSLQPLHQTDTGERSALFLQEFNLSLDALVEHRLDGTKIEETTHATVPTNSTLSTEIIGDDDRICTLAFIPGTLTAEIITLPYRGFPKESITSNKLDFAIGSILPVPSNIPGAEHGLLLTSSDGKIAAYAHLLSGKIIEIVEIFPAGPDNLINALVPLPNRGFIALTNSKDGGPTTGWSIYNEDNGWKEVAKGTLSPWLPLQQNFATFFWFDAEALVDPSAQLVKLETFSDWTQKDDNSAIPEKVALSRLGTPAAGLTPDGNTVPSPPPGASYLLTNQYGDNASLSALDSDATILVPGLTIEPASGTYQQAVTIAANYDEESTELYYRDQNPGASWQLFDDLTVSYPSKFLFYARNTITGVSSPIIIRHFDFPTEVLNSLDSDRDGVPDYVEKSLGLDPTAGADSDGDFQSDLEEILAETDPNDPESRSESDVRQTAFIGEGFELLAQAFVNATGNASLGETLAMHGMQADLLAEEVVIDLTLPVELAGLKAAHFKITSPVPERSFITLSSPTYFNLGTGANPPRNGRENIRVLSRPKTLLPTIAHTPDGADADSDRDDWITAARVAYDNFEPVSEIIKIHPQDNAASVVLEQALFNALTALPASEEKAALNLPAAIENFTLFGFRDGENAKTQFSENMAQFALKNGCDFRAMIEAINTALDASAALADLNQDLYLQHRELSESNPLMLLPLDALRGILRTGDIPDSDLSDEPRPNPYSDIDQNLIDIGRAAMIDALSALDATKRPTEQWTIVIAPSTHPLHQYDYVRQSNEARTWLLDSFGDREELEQGLGLPLGTIIQITGFTDVESPTGFEALEVISVDSVVAPLASNSDTNGNLLDDEWELFFFGKLGTVSGLDLHPASGHSYLQYQIAGADPRSGNLEDPVVSLTPEDVKILWIPAANAYEVSFDFPAAYLENFDFSLSSSESLENFAGTANFGNLRPKGGNRWALRIKAAQSSLARNFFRLEMSLSAP